MLKKMLLAGLSALATSTAYAQTYPVPTDILEAGHWGADGWDEQVPTYAAGTTLNVLGDGTLDGGTPPAAAFEFTDIAHDLTGWENTDAQSENYFCTLISYGGECSEPKARFTAEVTHYAYHDPIRNFCLPGTSHLHMFFGNANANACSTFETLRNNAPRYSFAAGGPANGTAYWFPAFIKENAFGDGKNWVVRIGDVTFYYREPSEAEAKKNTYLLLGLRYVAGFNMDDANVWFNGVIAAANAQPGTSSTRYKRCPSTSESTSCDAVANYVCDGAIKKAFVNADGTDPWGGACTAAKDMIVQITAPTCWDGRNFWSPGGYKHVVAMIQDSVTGEGVCPNGWFRIPQLIFNIEIEHEGPADYMTWKLASDPITGSANTGTINGVTVRRGETFHIDWFNGWQRAPLRSWHDNCIGIANNPHECLDSTVGPSERLFRAEPAPAPYARSQVVRTNRTFGTATESTMWPIKAGPVSVMHVHAAENEVPSNLLGPVPEQPLFTGIMEVNTDISIR